MEPAPCPTPEEKRRAEILAGILHNYASILPLSQEMEKRINGIHLLSQETDQYFYEHIEGLRDPLILKHTPTNNMVNLALETQAHLKRLKDIIRDLDKIHHSLDFFPWDKSLANQLRQQDLQEGSL